MIARTEMNQFRFKPFSVTASLVFAAVVIAGIQLHDVQTADRLDKGDTIGRNRGGGRGQARFAAPQLIEVTPAKKIAWVLQDYAGLPSCSAVQLLDQSGRPFAIQMHNAGLFDEYKDVEIETNSRTDDLITTTTTQ